MARGWAEAVGARDLFSGVNAIDYSGYPDCRPEFIAAFEAMANTATKAGVEGAHFRIHTPLAAMSKADIVGAALAVAAPMALTWSCYDPTPTGTVCSECDSCRLRAKGFADAGIADPAL